MFVGMIPFLLFSRGKYVLSWEICWEIVIIEIICGLGEEKTNCNLFFIFYFILPFLFKFKKTWVKDDIVHP